MASRGLSQGDPLSPFLYLLVADVFSSMLESIHAEGSIEGFLIGRKNVHISHLQSFFVRTMMVCSGILLRLSRPVKGCRDFLLIRRNQPSVELTFYIGKYSMLHLL